MVATFLASMMNFVGFDQLELKLAMHVYSYSLYEQIHNYYNYHVFNLIPRLQLLVWECMGLVHGMGDISTITITNNHVTYKVLIDLKH